MSADGADHLGIVELVDRCAAMRRRHEMLFERLGGWVASTDRPAVQQLFAEACHRHAWHAELWAGRLPAIGRSADVALPDAAGDEPDAPTRLVAYRDELAELAERHAEIRRRIDPLLDPATIRVLDLVDADLAALAERAAAVA